MNPSESPTLRYCPEKCANSPCDCDNVFSDDYDANCIACHENGCNQCDQENGYFKPDFDRPCVQCQDIFGDGCLHCQDFNGCAQCDQENGYQMQTDIESECQLNYCVLV